MNNSSSTNRDPAKLLPMTKEEKRAYVIDVVTHLANLEKSLLPSTFTGDWREIVREGIEQMWEFVEEFTKREGLS